MNTTRAAKHEGQPRPGRFTAPSRAARLADARLALLEMAAAERDQLTADIASMPIEQALGIRTTVNGVHYPLLQGQVGLGPVRHAVACSGGVWSGEARQAMGSAFGRGNSLPSDELGDDEDTLVDAAPPWGSL